MKTRSLFATTIAALAVVVAFGMFVWPTTYVFVTHDASVTRINRFTGVEEYSSANGWIRLGGADAPAAAKVVTGSLLVKEMNYDPSSSLGELVLQNRSEESMKAVHLEMSLIDHDGVVVGTTTQDVDKIEKGDRVRVNVYGTTTTGSASLIRIDRAYSDWTPGTTVASL